MRYHVAFLHLVCLIFFVVASAGFVVISMKCKADRGGGCYILNGNKMCCTNGPMAQTLVVSFKIYLHFFYYTLLSHAYQEHRGSKQKA